MSDYGMKKFLKNSHILKTKLLEKVQIEVDGHALSKRDNIRVINAMVYLAGVIRDTKNSVALRSNAHLCRQLSDQSILLNMAKLLQCLDFAYIQKQFKSMLLAIRHIPGKGMSTHSAKLHLRKFEVDSVPFRGNELLMTVREMCLYLLKCDDEPTRIELFRLINTVVQFTARLTLHDVDWIIEEEVQKYLALESEMKTWVYDNDIVQELNTIMKEWLSDIDLITDNPTDSHGYGATRDVHRSAGTACKWRSMMANSAKEHFFAAQLLGVIDHEAVEKTTLARLNDYINGRPIPEELQVQGRYSVFQLVAKGYNQKRGVSMEDTPNQYYQKILFDRIDRHLQCHSNIGIHLHEQELNRDLARFGSISHQYGTIDLSSASDTVTWTLVQGIFKDTPVLPVMRLLRTPKCYLADADVWVTLEKAFPMGSAVCFPIESLTFAALCELANRHMGVHRDYLVYGDDMVVHNDTADEVMRLLEVCNFKANLDKSYLPGCAFTESCGGEYYHFYDVSPLRLSRKIDFVVKVRTIKKTKYVLKYDKKLHKKVRKKVTRCLSVDNKESIAENLRDLYNKAYVRNYKTLARMLLQDGIEFNRYLYFSINEEGWLSEYPRNSHLEHRYVPFDSAESSIKGEQIRTRILRSRIRKDRKAEALRLERWFESRQAQLVRYKVDSMVIEKPEYITRLLADGGCSCNVGSAYSQFVWKWLPDPRLF